MSAVIPVTIRCFSPDTLHNTSDHLPSGTVIIPRNCHDTFHDGSNDNCRDAFHSSLRADSPDNGSDNDPDNGPDYIYHDRYNNHHEDIHTWILPSDIVFPAGSGEYTLSAAYDSMFRKYARTYADHLLHVLTVEETKQYQAFRSKQARQLFVAAHIMLHLLLACYLQKDPASFRFSRNIHGKPFLPAYPDMHFNLSHSGDWIALAFSRAYEVGIDIEGGRSETMMDGIVRHHFHPSEYSEYLALDPPERNEWFFRRWTVREAFLKGLGTGLSTSLESFRVQQIQESIKNPNQLYMITEGLPAYSKWRIRALPAPENYSCCVAYPIARS